MNYSSDSERPAKRIKRSQPYQRPPSDQGSGLGPTFTEPYLMPSDFADNTSSPQITSPHLSTPHAYLTEAHPTWQATAPFEPAPDQFSSFSSVDSHDTFVPTFPTSTHLGELLYGIHARQPISFWPLPSLSCGSPKTHSHLRMSRLCLASIPRPLPYGTRLSKNGATVTSGQLPSSAACGILFGGSSSAYLYCCKSFAPATTPFAPYHYHLPMPTPRV